MKYLLSLIISGALVVSGFGQTRNVLVGTNNAVVQPTNFWSADAANARSGLGLGTAATNPASAFQPSSSVLSNLASGNGVAITNIAASNIVGAVAVANGGTGATNAATARTNLGLGWSALTNTDATNFRNAIGLGTTNDVTFKSVTSQFVYSSTTNASIEFDNNAIIIDSSLLEIRAPINFYTTTNAATTRTNLGIPWSGLTNTDAATFQSALFGANTNPVLVDTNGEVVSPTNFWQAAPITTAFIESQPSTNSTTNITAARFLHIHSLNTNVTVTNTIVLPTNGSTFNGDIALIVHQGLTNSVTRVRAAGSTNDIATMTRYNEAIEFVYYNNAWQFNHNQAFTEPIYFAGTNAAGHAAESRTNLGLGNISTNTNGFVVINTEFRATNGSAVFTNLQTEYLEFGVNNSYLYVSGTNATNIVFEEAVARTNFIHGLGLGPTNNVQFLQVQIGPDVVLTDSGELQWSGSSRFSLETMEFYAPILFDNTTNAAQTRTNLGIPLAALTNTNNTTFRDAIELGATNDVTFNNVVASGTLTSTGAVTFVTNLNVGGAIAVTNAAETRTNLGIPLAALTNTTVTNFHQAIFYTNTAPSNIGGNLGTIAAWIEIVASNGVTYKIPAYTNVP